MDRHRAADILEGKEEVSKDEFKEACEKGVWALRLLKPSDIPQNSDIDHWPVCLNCNGHGILQTGPWKGETCSYCNGIGRRSPGLSNERAY